MITDVYHAPTPLRAPVHETNAQTTPPPRDETTPPQCRREVPSRRQSTTSRPRRAMKNPRARESVTIQPFDLFIIQYQYTPRASPAFLRRRRRSLCLLELGTMGTVSRITNHHLDNEL